MKINRINLLCCLLATVLMLGMSSCAKEKGCTDPASPSFNADAEKDDESCITIADALAASNWSASETVNSTSTAQFDATITRVQDDSILITNIRTTLPPAHALASMKVKVNWLDKSVKGQNNDVSNTSIAGEINSLDELQLTYYFTTLISVDTIDVIYTKE